MRIKCWKIDFMNGTERTYEDVFSEVWKEPFIVFRYSTLDNTYTVTLRTSLIACIEEYYKEKRSNTDGTTTTTQTDETNNSTSESA